MAGWSDSIELSLLNQVFGATAFSPAATHFIALFTSPPNDNGTGGTEVSAGGYARLSFANNSATWAAATSVGGLGTKTNAAAFTWAPATTAWGTVVAAAIFTAATGGTMIASGTISPAMVIGVGAVANIPPGNFVITLD
jgi:hypothetical protein